MNYGQFGKLVLLLVGSVLGVFFGVDAFAAATSGVGAVAGQALSSLPNIARLITAGAYVAGMGFAIGAIVKFKAHKDNPTQVHLSQGVVLLFVGAALIFVPALFQAAGGTLFGASGAVGKISGLISF